jgi:DNA polymerase I-like protein with 3'-5' exonuclease and polymerase domains
MVVKEDLNEADLKKPKKAKEKKPKKAKAPDKDLRTIFTERLGEINMEEVKKPWMATKSFRLINTMEALEEWVEVILRDTGRHHNLEWSGHNGPVIAVDTETDGLDVRVINGKMKTNLAGVCLSADGMEGLYLPVGHLGREWHTYTKCGSRSITCTKPLPKQRRLPARVRNLPAAELAAVLQRLFDQSHLVFFNAKFDREILRLSLGLTFRDFPFFEDVQVLSYLYDPKAKVDPGAGGFQSGGLKATSKSLLGIEQIELEELTKVRAKVWNEELQKATYKMVYAPFTWVPTSYALWYAAGDAITTWLLWQKFHELQDFRKMSGVHRLDHLLIDTLTWIERQRIRVDAQRLQETINFHENRVRDLTRELGVIAGIEDFNPGSTPQLRKILFEDRAMEVLDVSEKTGDASTSITVLKELQKKYPDDEFLGKLMDFREYSALHPGNLIYEKEDNTARFYFKQNVVAGGRLAAAGGEYTKDGGCGLNPQAIKKVGGNWWVKGKRLDDQEAIEDEAQFDQKDLDPSCFNRDGKVAPNIRGNHYGTYFGIRYCMVPKCKVCQGKVQKVDANEVINLRGLFTADPGWTMFSIDYSNIEMRVAANVSKEKAFIHEFLEGSGDFHTLTAKALFPEFSDPATPKGRTKELRSLAKIVNFALLYGGTAYTIYENLNKAGFNMSFEEAEELVNRYWDSVPTFAEWCQMKRGTARKNLLCKTPTGRVIHFESAMKGYGITQPDPTHRDAFFVYKKLKKAETEYLKNGQKEEARAVKRQADAIYQDPETGVRNYQEYNRFLGKAERVSINIPLQGTAGDLMRSALNRIRIWATSMPGVEKVFRLHETVHDEIDFSVKNEFVPYILPRVNRLMKLRAYHKQKEWPVPIETDCEYGQTWDVQHHLTGDNEHTAAAWTEIPGLETYLPPEFDQRVVTQAVQRWSQDPEKVKSWLRQCHPRTHHLIDKLKHVEGEPWHLAKGVEAILQLHEFWTIDEDEEDTQTLVDYMEEQGLNFPDEPLTGGLDSYLASVPVPSALPPMAPALQRAFQRHKQLLQPPPVPQETPAPKVEVPAAEEPEEDMFYEAPRKPAAVQSEPKPKLPVMRSLNVSEAKAFERAVGLGAGTNSFSFIYEPDKGIRTVHNAQVTTLPPEFMA